MPTSSRSENFKVFTDARVTAPNCALIIDPLSKAGATSWKPEHQMFNAIQNGRSI
jgi:hypothetical protein